MWTIRPNRTLSALPVTLKAKCYTRHSTKLEAFQQKYLKDVNVVKASVVSGTNYKRIIDYVESEGIDLVIMGTGYHGAKSDVWRGCGEGLQAVACSGHVSQGLKRMYCIEHQGIKEKNHGKKREKRDPYFWEALISILGLIIFISLAILRYETDAHVPILLGVFVAAVIGMRAGFSGKRLKPACSTASPIPCRPS
jgi:hypothetical protein